ncbi:hypothetical protein HNP84_006497 [Thermocatellispora tengchongensis]|uniref:Condensation domain-containing protein n=1 Tax=Thermocatellispora tengchongensis TaxID=1073253 RepID=A0A840PDE4_9ACTN|nr:condensation domain-containing protein [Thermocatellispora tengchongensis]MBB5136746.1 hypothetical protein [Thermocatellispora tengchongensis]
MTGADRRQALLTRLAELPPEQRDALHASLLRRPRERTWPLTRQQEQFWYINQFAKDPAGSSYHIPWCVRLRGPIDQEALATALTRIVERHHTLRVRFRLVDDRLVQVLMPPEPVPLPLLDVADEEEAALAAFIDRPFDLENDPPLRAALLRLADDEAVLCVVLHHIVADAWSLNILLREMAECYTARWEGREPDLPELPIQFPDFAAEDGRRDHSAALEHWTRTLAGSVPLDLPIDRPRPPRWTGHADEEHFRISEEAVVRLEEAARRERGTLFTAMVTAYQVALGLLAGQDDVCVGVPTVGRARTELEPLIGCFSTVIVMRADLSGDPAFRELHRRTRVALLRGLQYPDMPWERLFESLGRARDLSRPSLYQVMFNLLNVPGDDRSRTTMADLEIEFFQPRRRYTHSELDALTVRDPVGLGGVFIYNRDQFSAATVRRFIAAFMGVVVRAGADPDLRISQMKGH